MIKKYTAMLLILAVMISALPASLFESVGYAAATNVAEVNGTGYASLSLAIEATNESTDPATIKLIGDVSDGTSITPYVSIAKGLTINLNGYTLKTNITVNRESGSTVPTIKIFDENASKPSKKLKLTENGYKVSADGVETIQGGVFEGDLNADGCNIELIDVTAIGNISIFPQLKMDNATVIGRVSGGLHNEIQFGTIIGEVDAVLGTTSEKVEYKVGNEVFATQYMSAGKKPIKPIINPTVNGGYAVCSWCSDEQLTVPYDFTGTTIPETIYGKVTALEAEVDGTLYEHLSDAIDYAVWRGKTVKLLRDIEYRTEIYLGFRLEFGMDLNGYVLKSNDTVADPDASPGIAKISDSSPDTIHKLKKTENGYEVDDLGNVTVKGGILFGCLNLNGYNRVELNGGTVIGDFNEARFSITGGTLRGNVTVGRNFNMSGGTVS